MECRNKRVFYNKEKILEDADIVDIAESLDFEINIKGKIKSVKCPVHNGEHFGHCVLFENNTFYCFVCNEGGNVITFVMAAKNCKYLEALEYLVSQMSNPDAYILSGEEKDRSNPKASLPAKDRNLLNIKNQSVWNVSTATDLCVDAEYLISEDDTKKCKIKKKPLGTFNTEYLILQKETNNPLFDLYENDREAYNWLICEKAKSEIQKRQFVIASNESLGVIDYACKGMNYNGESILSDDIIEIYKDEIKKLKRILNENTKTNHNRNASFNIKPVFVNNSALG